MLYVSDYVRYPLEECLQKYPELVNDMARMYPKRYSTVTTSGTRHPYSDASISVEDVGENAPIKVKKLKYANNNEDDDDDIEINDDGSIAVIGDDDDETSSGDFSKNFIFENQYTSSEENFTMKPTIRFASSLIIDSYGSLNQIKIKFKAGDMSLASFKEALRTYKPSITNATTITAHNNDTESTTPSNSTEVFNVPNKTYDSTDNETYYTDVTTGSKKQ